MRRLSMKMTALVLLAAGALGGCGGDAEETAAPANSGGVPGFSTGQGGQASAGQAGQGGQAGSGGSGGAPAKITAVVDLRADNNRDGVVNLDDPADDEGEETWDKTHGAIFLANIDDDEKKCAASGNDVDLPKCHDAADDVINGADDLLDLARLKTQPWADAPDDASARIVVSEQAASLVRLFKNDGSGNFTVFPADATLTAEELRAGVELAIEATDIVRDAAAWDGFVDLTLEVSGGETAEGGSDTLRMRVSPVMLHHHLQPAEQVHVAKLPYPESVAMRTDLKKAVSSAKVPGGLLELSATSVASDQWTQDYFETGYMAMPTPEGNHIVRVAYRSANVQSSSTKNPLRPAGKVVFNTFRGKDFAAIQQFDIKHSGQMDSLNSFGNTETVPPYTLGDKSFPLGRVFRGSIKSFYPDKAFSRMIEAQSVQPPIYVDTSWLLVGHVDETISFIKANTPRGWVLAINDAALAKKMLEEQVAKGNGQVKMFVGKTWNNFDGTTPSAEISIEDVLKDTDIMAKSAEAIAEVDGQLAILKKEVGLTDDEILHIPFLHMPADGYSIAYQPGTVNGVYLSDTVFGAPKPHGPVIDGKDIFEAQLEEEFAKVGVTVAFIEDWDLYHALSGEVHCGTNTTRKVDGAEKWWESGFLEAKAEGLNHDEEAHCLPARRWPPLLRCCRGAGGRRRRRPCQQAPRGLARRARQGHRQGPQGLPRRVQGRRSGGRQAGRARRQAPRPAGPRHPPAQGPGPLGPAAHDRARRHPVAGAR